MQWIQDNNISLLPLPAYSPDLNIIENVWGIMTSNIFKHGRQFTDLHEFEWAIRESWDAVDNETVTRMVESMPKRLQDVIHKKGNMIGV